MLLCFFYFFYELKHLFYILLNFFLLFNRIPHARIYCMPLHICFDILLPFLEFINVLAYTKEVLFCLTV